MAFQIRGKIEVIGATTPVTSKDGTKTFYRRELILDCTRFNPQTGEPWENHPKFELSNNSCSLLDNLQVGQQVDVTFVLRGSKYVDEHGQTAYFTNISAYKIELVQQQMVHNQQQTAPQGQTQYARPNGGYQPQQAQPYQGQSQGYAPQQNYQGGYQQPVQQPMQNQVNAPQYGNAPAPQGQYQPQPQGPQDDLPF